MSQINPSHHPVFILENINNGQLKGRGAMPLKDLTSDNENNFAMQRHEYMRSFVLPNQPTAQTNRKMWYGNSANRLSSNVVERRKMNAVGQGSLNLNSGLYSMTNNNDKNYIQRALNRVRRMGGAAPPKKGGVSLNNMV